jgi:septum formation protein
MADADATSPLILASGSPRRRQLLATLGIPFAVEESGLNEETEPDLPPEVVVRQLARAKAEAVAAGRATGVIVGCDTIVVLDGRIIGKPRDEAEARATLRALRAAPHRVFTGLSVIDLAARRSYGSAVVTMVIMGDYDDATIDRYVATGEPMDKAGSYAAQGEGARLIARIDGCYANVVGLPLCELVALLRPAGIAAPTDQPVCRLPDGRPCPRLTGVRRQAPGLRSGPSADVDGDHNTPRPRPTP